MADFLQIDVECLYLSHRQVVGQNETVDLLQVGPIAHNDLQAEFRQNFFISVIAFRMVNPKNTSFLHNIDKCPINFFIKIVQFGTFSMDFDFYLT